MSSRMAHPIPLLGVILSQLRHGFALLGKAALRRLLNHVATLLNGPLHNPSRLVVRLAGR